MGMRISCKLATVMQREQVRLAPGTSVVSFTFDDAPVSACTTGADILARHGARGTFYVAGGLTDRIEEGRPCHSEANLRTLHAQGHELGCHGYSHQRYDQATVDHLTEELDRNAAFLADIGVDPEQLNFAYPFGAYSLRAKRVCAPRFVSSRITGNGLHRGQADLNLLGSYRLYGSTVADTHWRHAIDSVAAGGWLIVNTHEVAEDFGPYGCSPQTLEAMLRAAVESGCKVMPVSAAIRLWRSL